MSSVMITIDIEALGTPERAGYGVVIPNLAMVMVPESFDAGNMSFIYTRIPVNEQLNKGLKVDGNTLHFWMADPERGYEVQNMDCARNEVLKSLVATDHITYMRWPCTNKLSTVGLDELRKIFSPDFYGGKEVLIFGKGCHFDYSILQENIRIRYGSADFSSYRAPQNVRTLELLFSTEELAQRSEDVDAEMQKFIDSLQAFSTDIGEMVLHHPLYDAAREALQVRWMLDRSKKPVVQKEVLFSSLALGARFMYPGSTKINVKIDHDPASGCLVRWEGDNADVFWIGQPILSLNDDGVDQIVILVE